MSTGQHVAAVNAIWFLYGNKEAADLCTYFGEHKVSQKER